MTKLESLQDIKDAAIRFSEMLIAANVADTEFRMAEEAMQQLVDRFYRENHDMMARDQYEAARKDWEYFARLVNLAMAHYSDGIEGGNESLG
jgi:hypothetical protein